VITEVGTDGVALMVTLGCGVGTIVWAGLLVVGTLAGVTGTLDGIPTGVKVWAGLLVFGALAGVSGILDGIPTGVIVCAGLLVFGTLTGVTGILDGIPTGAAGTGVISMRMVEQLREVRRVDLRLAKAEKSDTMW
jgi:hypothetical protein